ncbi:uncharacterized protein LOC144429512 [Styela clava]
MKELPVIKEVLFWILLSCCGIKYSEATGKCDCKNTQLGTKSINITYGPTNEHNCNCDWIVPTSMETNHGTAVVLLLQNVSLPMHSHGSPECSGEIRFPSTDSHKCDFTTNYCLTFTTASTICNINKIREKIPVANHTCDSIIPWNNAGGSPYKIQYYSRGYVGYKKYFTIQYLVLDCRSSTTTPETKTTTYNEETARGNSTRINPSLSTDIYNETTIRGSDINNNNKSNTDGNSISQISSTSAPQEQILTPTTIIIIVASALGLLIILISGILIKRFCRSDNNKISKTIEQENDKVLEERSEREIVENAIYGRSLNDQQGPETIINEIYDTTPDTNDETTKTDDPCLYAVVQKKE